MAIERFVNGKQLKELYNKRNPKNKIGYPTALKWIKEWKKEFQQKSEVEIFLPNDRVIPYSWVEEKLGKGAYNL